MAIDLHTHSTASDGSASPAEVVRLAARAGLDAVALTDHDTVEGLAEATVEADRAGVRLVPGCEISCDPAGRFPGTMHLLVYFLDRRDDRNGTDLEAAPLPARFRALREARNTRNEKIVAALHDHGVDIALDDVLAEAGGGSVGRPHVAAVLVRAGVVGSVQEAFDVWLAKGRPAYLERDRLGVEEAIALARASGGVTSVAHPYSVGLTGDDLDAFVATLATLGLDALEAVYGRYSPAERGALTELAIRHGLAVTGGSDFHGAYKPDLAVGTGTGDLHVPGALLAVLEARRS